MDSMTSFSAIKMDGTPGRHPKPKEFKEPGKPGRPRKEKPVETGPKRPVSRPRKNPQEEILKEPGRRGRLRKDGIRGSL
jgi:hypothetical protein